MSMYAVAKGAKISYAQVHRFMSGKRAPTLGTVDRICDFLGLELRKREEETEETKGSKRRTT
jgi:DNA-binding phage protein